MERQMSRHTPAAQLRQEVEARTGAMQNMKLYGFRAIKFTLAGEPTRWVTFQRGEAPLSPGYVIQRTPDKRWRVISVGESRIYPKGGPEQGIPREVKCGDGLTFPGPVTAALWLQVEISNGSLPAYPSQSAARA